ncbi:PR domain zinc finger protein 15-like [Hetaerina americana]|uniref:PR domain zinc finger protein 15-like n=1 Tax=Hetaerina americana TaxID=62018 RepID=UPI003A7F221D
MISHSLLDNTLPSTSVGPEFNLKGCNVCGQNHSTEACPFLGTLLPVQDTKTKTKARLTLPANLEVQTLADGSPTVVARTVFERGTQFGPFQARRTPVLQLTIDFPLKVFSKDSEESYYLDTSDEEFCNWMCLVSPATLAKEQNLMCYQMKQDIYYTVMKRIQPGEQLRVWYAPYYAVKMGVVQAVKRKPDALTDHVYGTPRKEKKTVQNMLLNKEVTEKIVEKLAPQQLGARGEKAEKSWRCRLCGEEVVKEGVGGGSGVATFAKHLMAHYRPRLGRSSAQKLWPCHICLQNFSGEKELLHHKVNAHKVAIRRPRLLGPQGREGPRGLTAEVQGVEEGNDGLDWQRDGGKTTSIVISRIPEGQESMMMKDAGCMTISVKPDGPVSGVELGPPYICDICSKEFHRAEYVYRHLRKHTGEFTCVSCMAVFARKESLQTHVCVGGVASTLYSCTYCPKVFSVPKLLKRHIAKHKSEFTCLLCKHVYASKASLDAHHCARDEEERNASAGAKTKSYNCALCGKGFVNQNYLRSHLSHHHPNDEHLGFSCQLCEKGFLLPESLEEHQSFCNQVKKLDAGHKATCPICESVLDDVVGFRSHVRDHTHPFFCQHCGARFKTRKASAIHMCDLDSGLKCEVCEEGFPSHQALLSHLNEHGTAVFHCFECSVSFFRSESFEKHSCSSCREARGDYKARRRKSRGQGGGKGTEGGGACEATGSKSLVCEICGAQYKSVYSLRAHVQLHGERRFECDICHKRFHRKDVLQEHISVHQDPQVPCPVCDKKVKTKKSLEVHMLLHKGERRHKCKECGKEFYQKGNLLKHAAVHEPVSKKAHPCPHCGKMFMSRDYLAVHLLEHTQGKVHQCALCNKAFVKEHLLRTHHRQYHNNQMYACRFCGQSMRLRQSLRRHLVCRHPEMRAEWEGVGVLDAMLVTRVAGEEAGRAVEGMEMASGDSASFVIQTRDTAIDVAESAEILLAVAAGGLQSAGVVGAPLAVEV